MRRCAVHGDSMSVDLTMDMTLDNLNLELFNIETGAKKISGAEDVLTANCVSTPNLRHMFKKIKSPESMAAEFASWAFVAGDCYHVISVANVDSFTWLRHMVDLQRIDYALVCTYALYADAVDWMLAKQQSGRIGRLDFYIGDNIEVVHPDAYVGIKRLLPACGGRLVVFKNHSKVIVLRGEKYNVLIESSANMNEKLVPHFENTCVTVDTELARETVDRFAMLQPLNRVTFAEPYKWE